MAMIIHATTLARRVDGRWRGVLVRAPSGGGKSDLALRALEAGWRLVADDRTRLWTSGGGLYARAPDTLFGLVEARGLGVLSTPALGSVRLALVLDAGCAERTPDPQTVVLAGVALPLIRLPLLESSCLAKLTLALNAVCRAGA